MGFDVENFVCATCPTEAKVDVQHICDCGKIGTYNRHSNTCVKCTDGSKGAYPHCDCDDKNAIYNEEYNRCKLCPIGSTGKIPECVCPNGQSMFKLFFIHKMKTRFLWFVSRLSFRFRCQEYSVFFNDCVTCDGIFEDDVCLNCPLGSNIMNQSCVCDGNAKYDKASNDCLTCPEDK